MPVGPGLRLVPFRVHPLHAHRLVVELEGEEQLVLQYPTSNGRLSLIRRSTRFPRASGLHFPIAARLLVPQCHTSRGNPLSLADPRDLKMRGILTVGSCAPLTVDHPAVIPASMGPQPLLELP